MISGCYTISLFRILPVASIANSNVTNQMIATFTKAPNGCTFSYPNVRVLGLG